MKGEAVTRLTTAGSTGAPVASRRSAAYNTSRWWQGILRMLCVTTLAIIVYTIIFVPWTVGHPGFWMSRDGILHEVTPESPAEAAGLRPGDRVIEIDGVRLQDIGGLDGHPGETARYVVDREGSRLEVRLPLTDLPLSDQAARIIEAALALAFWFASVAVWSANPRGRIARRFLFVGLALALVEALDFHGARMQLWALAGADAALLAAVPALFALFATFPVPMTQRWQRWGGGLVYTIGATLIIWGVGEYAVKGPMGVSQAFRDARDAYFIAMLLWIGWMAIRPIPGSPGLIAAAWRRLTGNGSMPNPTPPGMGRRRLLLLGAALSFAPTILAQILPLIDAAAHPVSTAYTLPWALLLPASILYAVRSGEFGRGERWVNRGLAGAAAIGVVIGSLAGVWPMIERWVPDGSGRSVVLTAFSVVTGLLVIAVYRGILWMVDWARHGGWYSFESVVGRANSGFETARGSSQLVAVMLDVARDMRFDQAVVFWRKRGKLDVAGGYGYPDDETLNWQLPGDGAIVRRLAAAGRMVAMADLITSAMHEHIADSERAVLICEDLRTWLPLLSRGECLGALVLGHRSAEDELSPSDQGILETVRASASTAAQRATLVERLEEQIDEKEKARQEVVEARDEERKRLADRLHEEPVQLLYRVDMDLAALHREGCVMGDEATLEPVRGRIGEAIASIRAVFSELYQQNLAFAGLATAIESDVAEFETRHPEIDVELRLDPSGRDRQLAPNQRDRLFGVYREAMQNAAKHSGASCIVVALSADEGSITLKVEDNGRGFLVPSELSEYAWEGHVGMLSMSDRAKALGSELRVQSEPGRGTVVAVTVPLS